MRSSLRDAGGLLAGAFTAMKGPRYHKIDWEGSDESDYTSRQVPLSRSLGRCLPCGLGRWSLKTVIATVGSLVILALLAVAGSQPVAPTPPAADDTDPHNRRLRIIVPADEPGANLCKMLLSTVANGYPAPLIINWGRDFHKQGGWFGGSHLGKIDGTLDALEALASDEEAPPAERLRPDDLVLIVDAYDVWFQLPPRVLIERFLAQNAAADARILAGWSADAPDAIAAPTQRVISTARTDLYGPETDKGDPDRDGHALHRTRPRYINSGAVLGRADDVLRTLRRAYAKVREGQDAGNNLFSDQGILGEILGQQEVWRTMQRERQALALAGEPFNETAYPPDVAAVGGGAETWEYGLGLDYLQELFVPTVFEEDDARIAGLPSDVDSLAPPLVHAGVELEEQHKDEAAHWDAVPLYTDYYTGRMPVGVHHNAHRDGMKVRPIKLAPLAVIKATSSWARDVVYWPPASDAERRRPRIFDRKTLSQGLDEAEWHTLGPEDLGPKRATNAVKPEVEVKKPGGETKADEKPQDEGQGERKPAGEAIIKR
ncbi:hypothetical protein HYQ45_002164 [Verticillium longisporum]|uniref:Uncharacterized protein n=1 Tax=Verticillium longisporum TaxID=100787 RepID=A0A8I3A0K9_VERLO|nr:hypothetical protein HYQ45_002164 [Verticillium longisporum]